VARCFGQQEVLSQFIFYIAFINLVVAFDVLTHWDIMAFCIAFINLVVAFDVPTHWDIMTFYRTAKCSVITKFSILVSHIKGL